MRLSSLTTRPSTSGSCAERRAPGRPWPKVRVVLVWRLRTAPSARNHAPEPSPVLWNRDEQPRARGARRPRYYSLRRPPGLRASPTWRICRSSAMQFLPPPPPRRPSSPSCWRSVLHISVDVSGMRSTSGRLVPALSRVGSYYTRAGEAPKGPAHGVWCALFPLPPCWRRVCGSAARHRSTGTAIQLSVAGKANQHWVVRARAIRSLLPVSLTYSWAGLFRHACTRHAAASAIMRAFGERRRVFSSSTRPWPLRRSPFPRPHRGHDAPCPGPLSSRQPARATNFGA